MFNKTLSALAVAAALLAAPASAQEMIKGMPIPAGELEGVRNHCETLAAAERVQPSEPVTDAGQGQGDHEENPQAEGGEADNAAGQGNAAGITELTAAEDANKVAGTAAINLDALTLEDCSQAGLAPAA